MTHMRDRPLNRTQPLEAPVTRRQRDRAEASTGSDQTHPSRTERKLTFPQASLRAQNRSRGAPRHSPTKVTPRITLESAGSPIEGVGPAYDTYLGPTPRPTPSHKRSGLGSQRALERPHPNSPRAFSAKARPLPTFPARAGPNPRSPQALAYESHPAYYVRVVSEGSVPHITHMWDRPPFPTPFDPFFRTYPEEPTGTQTKHQPKQAISDCRTPLV